MKKSRPHAWLFGGVILLLIFFNYFGWLKYPKIWLQRLFSPVAEKFYQQGEYLGNLKNYQFQAKENLRLKEELSRLSVDYIKLAGLAAENDALRKELNFLQLSKFDYQIVGIIGRLPLNDNMVILNAGANVGLQIGMPLTVNQGIVIGKIAQVEENRSYGRLLTDTASQLAISFGESNNTNGLLTGQAGNSLVIDLISQDQVVTDGEIVITSGLEEMVPRGLLVGNVSKTDQKVGQIFKQARIEPPFSYQNLRNLTVIKVLQK
ncbi:MAG: rod shape-determining protein MreC [Patescibacteria group bacterium]|jgi:rod shape-determining protein MreC